MKKALTSREIRVFETAMRFFRNEFDKAQPYSMFQRVRGGMSIALVYSEGNEDFCVRATFDTRRPHTELYGTVHQIAASMRASVFRVTGKIIY